MLERICTWVLYLVVELLQRAGGLQHVLDVVRRVIDDDLCNGRHWRKHQRDHGRTDQGCIADGAKDHETISRDDATVSCARAGSGVSKSAAQSSPLRRSQAGAKSRPCSASTSAMATWSAF